MTDEEHKDYETAKELANELLTRMEKDTTLYDKDKHWLSIICKQAIENIDGKLGDK